LPACLLSCGTDRGGKALVVGGLPVTCNLTLPIAYVARAAANREDPSPTPRFCDYGRCCESVLRALLNSGPKTSLCRVMQVR